jgi:hypothetical protein
MVPLLAVLGCGARSGIGAPQLVETVDASTDSTSDTATGGAIDAGDPLCGTGTCTAGDSCTDGCKWCRCAGSEWSCGTLCPADDGGVLPTAPPCPVFVAEDSYCPLEGQSCAYASLCGDIDRMRCTLTATGRLWKATRAVCTRCPSAIRPTLEDFPPCTEGLECPFDNDCGGKTILVCGGSSLGSGSWATENACGPHDFPDVVCPHPTPTAGASCDLRSKCRYLVTCPDTDFVGEPLAFCPGDGSPWVTTEVRCPPPAAACPKTPPAPGSACATTSDCIYDGECGSLVTAHCTGSGGYAVFKTPCRPGE